MLLLWRQKDLQGTLVKIKTHASISPHSNTAAVLRAAPTSWASLRRDQILLKLTILLKIYAKLRQLLSGAINTYLLAFMQDEHPTCISKLASQRSRIHKRNRESSAARKVDVRC